MIKRITPVLRDKKLLAIFILVLVTLCVGVVFYHRVEGWNMLDSTYFCIVTLTTVGYGDITPQTELGRGFTIGYLLIGVGIILAFITIISNHMIENYRRIAENYIEQAEKDVEQVLAKFKSKE